MYNLYIGHKPILDKEKSIEFYDILFDQKEQSDSFVSDALIIEALRRIDASGALETRRAFVKVDTGMFGGSVFDIPRSPYILNIPASEKTENKFVHVIADLKERGYTLSLYDFDLKNSSMQRYDGILKYISFIKIRLGDAFTADDESREVIKALKDKGIIIIADDVMNEERYGIYESMGCDLFAGYYFLNAAFFKNEEPVASKREILRLHSALIQESDFDVIAQEFKKSAAVSLLLLKYINSGAFHFKNRISSIRHILTLVGREPLEKWLMLVMYSAPHGTVQRFSSLMYTVKSRSELMERILKKIIPDIDKTILNQGYFVSVLSLADVLFGEDLEVILQELNVYDVVRDALIHFGGVSGEVYALIKDIEEFRSERIAEFESRYGLELGSISEIVIDSMREVAAFERAVTAAE